MVFVIIIAVILLFPLVWLIATYNRFQSVTQHLRESWADVEVELQRRYDLIPNLVETVKGYAAHERETLERVVELRNQAAANHERPDRQSGDEQALEAGLGRLIAVAEGYPDLKADANFLELQRELANTEDRIAAGRRFYNGNVRELNQLCVTVPSSIVAGMFGFESQGFFESGEDARTNPRVDLDR